MKKPIHLLRVALLLCCAALALPAFAQSETEARIERITTGLIPSFVTTETKGMRLQDRLAHYNVPGVSIAVIDDGKLAWARGFGVADSSTKIPVEANTLFQAASISKPVSAMAALKLVAQGKLALDQDVNTHLRSWRVPESALSATEKVTLRRVLSHSAGLTVSGFPGYVPGAAIPTAAQVLEGVPPANTPAVRLFYTPKSKTEYSGGGYTLLQQLLMDVSGEPFETLLQRELLKPLGMESSTFSQPLAVALERTAASGHNAKAEVIAGRYRTHPELAAAGLWTTPADLAKFAIEVQRAFSGVSNSIVPQSLARDMLSVQSWPYGLGFVLEGEEASARFSHRGANEGFQCILIELKERGTGVVIMTNGNNGNGLIQEIIRAVATEYQWPALAPTRYAVKTLPADALAQYAGYFADAQNKAVRVRLHQGALFAQSGGGWSPVAAFGDDAFALREQQTELRFSRDAQGRIQSLNAKNESTTRAGFNRTKEPALELSREPFFLRGSMNGWSTANTMKELSQGVYSARIALKSGFNEFKVASADFNAINLGTLPISAPAKPGQTLPLVAVGGNIPLMLADAGLYEFTLRVSDERDPEISIQKIE